MEASHEPATGENFFIFAMYFIWNCNPFFDVNHVSKKQWDDFFID